MNYINTFRNRARSFLYAVNKYNYPMNNELQIAVNTLNLTSGDTLLNLGGAGLDLKRFINKKVNYIPLEFSSEFADISGIRLIKHHSLDFNTNSIDKVLVLALMHHFDNKEREQLYKEVYRVLKPGGKFIVADVIRDSLQDFWLNNVVDKYNPFGHSGLFFTEEDKHLFTKCGFDVKVEIKKYTWYFENTQVMLEYLRNLFYLSIKDKELLDVATNVLRFYNKDNQVHFDWQLIYFICSKSNLNQESIPIHR